MSFSKVLRALSQSHAEEPNPPGLPPSSLLEGVSLNYGVALRWRPVLATQQDAIGSHAPELHGGAPRAMIRPPCIRQKAPQRGCTRTSAQKDAHRISTSTMPFPSDPRSFHCPCHPNVHHHSTFLLRPPISGSLERPDSLFEPNFQSSHRKSHRSLF